MKRILFFIVALLAFAFAQGDVQARLQSLPLNSQKLSYATSQNIRQQPAGPESAQVAGIIVRTLVYHELTALSPRGVARDYPLISGDGTHVVYALRDNPSRVYVCNFDGTGTREVDSLPDPPRVDISYDGSRVMATTYAGVIHVVNAASGTPVTVWDKGGIDEPNTRLSPDGNQVFFQLKFDLSNDFKSGIWVVSANGGAAQRIVSPEQVAAVIGLPAGEVSFYSGAPGLDVSQDGTRFTFIARVQGMMRVFAGGYVGGSLQGLHQILEPIINYGVQHIVISGDGTKVGYDIQQPTNNIFEAGVINFENVNGQGKQVIATSDQITPPIGFPNYGQSAYRIFLNRDGSKLLLGGTSYLYDTLTRSVIQLGIEFGALSGDTAHVVYNGLFVPSMNAAATRFTYLVSDANNVEQLATLEITSSIGASPNLSLPTIDPPFVLTDTRSTTTLTVKATAGSGVNRVSASFLRNGLDDVYVCVGDRQKPVLLDNGTQGDTVAADTIYTNNGIRTVGGVLAVPGPRVVRYQAETKTGDNKRHATAIDVESLTVTEQTPLIDVAPTSLDFGDVTVGQNKDLALTVRNIGGVSLTINSLDIDNARFSTPGTTAPFTINAGATQTITVRFAPTATGQQRGTLTINSTDPARPTVTVALAGNGVSTGGVTITDHTMTGGPIPGACAKPTVKTAFATTDTEAIQWTFASGLSLGDAIRWEWVQPNGTVYRTFDHTVTQVTQGQACFWDAIQIAGQQAASLPGNWQVRVYIKGAQVLTENFTISQGGGACPAITSISPSNGAVGASVTITGTGFTGVSGVKFANNIAATFLIFGDTQIISIVPNGAVTGPITISEPNCNDAQSSTSFTVTPPANNRIVRVVCGSATLGGTLTVPIELVSQGDENALGFSLTFDPTVLSNPQAAKGSDATSAALNTNSNQVAQGRFGIALALPTGQSFTAGVRQIAVVTFTVSATTTATTTAIGFGDAPILRRVSDANAQVLTATYQSDTCATIAILRGYEADVTPRPNGKNDGTVSINDWVMVGRFAAALDTPAAGSEFQRADCAPRNSKGDGILAVDDWVQAGRYYAALDAVQTIGGPSAPTQFRIAEFAFRNLPPTPTNSSVPVRVPRFGIRNQQRVLRAVNATLVRGQTGTLSIEMDSLGNENAVGFSLNFDPNVLTYVSAATGSAAPNAFLIINNSQVASGKLGLAIAQPAGEKFAAGTRQVATVRFTVAANTAASTTISFGDQPVKRQIADVNALTLTASYTDGSMTLVNSVACVSAASFRATDVASEAIIAAFGLGMATSTQEAATVPLPTQLAGTTVTIKDSTGTDRLAPLFFVSANQINYQMPPGTATGQTAVTIRSGNGTVSLGAMALAMVAPGLFAANATGQGVAAAVALRVKADGSQIYESVSQWDAGLQQYVSMPIDLGAEGEQVYLILFGTGVRFLSSQSAASATVGGSAIPLLFIGPQGDFVGLDQVNLGPVPRSLIGRGEIDVALTVDGKTANTVKVNLR
ncbi:MAG: choice-of-anchor D domain-containing protein [Acidobacteria bacterium]|nr:choice-of-anchor D domain-containing protein [Acidobacteriota bacterium]